MTRDLDVLRSWINVVVTITAICVTAVPLIYSFSPWRLRPLGKLYMWQSVSFAAAFDLGVLFMFWRPDILLIFWISAFVYTAIAGSTASMAFYIWRTNSTRKQVLRMLLNEQLYNLTKKVVQLGLPGVSTLYFTLALIWGFPNADKVSGTMAAVAVFLGAILGLSSKTYNETDAKFDGTLVVEENEEGSMLRLTDVDVRALDMKNEITLKMVRPTPVP